MLYYTLDIAYATHEIWLLLSLASLEFGFSREHIADICYVMPLIVFVCSRMHGLY